MTTQPSAASPHISPPHLTARHHHRSQSAEALTSTSFLHLSSAADSTTTFISPSTAPARQECLASTPTPPYRSSTPRRTKLFGFTPTEQIISSRSSSSTSTSTVSTTNHGEDYNSTRTTPNQFQHHAEIATTSFSNTISLVPLHFKPSHLIRTASDYPSTSSHAEGIREAFSVTRQTIMVRKKSGELVRSSMKLGEMTKVRPPARSAPSSPASSIKIVHFDNERLEEVKPFLARQRPAAVSRSGSPIETETEDEPESFPFPAMSTTQPGLLALRLLNFPKPININQEACLESLEITVDGKMIKGVVRVQNISFKKWVAVRFTLDNWATVSEVSADHLESIAAGKADRFSFSIKLQDLLAKIEEKIMLIAVRYRIEGREIWDNNAGANYHVGFTKCSPPASFASPLSISPAATITVAVRPATNRKQPSWTGQAEALRHKLNLLVADDFEPAPIQSNHDQLRLRSFTEEAPTAFNSRYEFSTSYQPTSSRSRAHPARSYSSSSSTSTSTTTFGSPVKSTLTIVNSLPTSYDISSSPSSPSSSISLPPNCNPTADLDTSSAVQRSPSSCLNQVPLSDHPNSESIASSRRSSVDSTASTSSSHSFTYSNSFPNYRPLVPQQSSNLTQHHLPNYITRRRKLVGSPLASPNGSPPRIELELSRVEQGGAGEERVISTGNFESFLDKYCFHTSSTSTSLGLSNLNLAFDSSSPDSPYSYSTLVQSPSHFAPNTAPAH